MHLFAGRLGYEAAIRERVLFDDSHLPAHAPQPRFTSSSLSLLGLRKRKQSNPHLPRIESVVGSTCLQPVPFTMLELDAAIDQQPPDRLGDRFAQAGGAGARLDLGNHFLDAGGVMDLVAARLDPRGGGHVALAFRQQAYERTVERV